MFLIIKDHIFFDGNKRTGANVSISFLEANGIFLKEEVESNDIVDLAIKVVSGEMSLEDLEEWFRLKTK